MPPCRVKSARSHRAHVAALFSAIFFVFPADAAERAALFSRFCPTCNFHNVESFFSHSQQFVVHGSTIPLRRLAERTNNPVLIDLDPQLVLVTAERTRRALCQEIGAPDNFADKIHISVLDRAPVGQPIAVVSQVHSDGFVYKVGVPSRVDRRQFARGLMQVALLEYANRGVRRCAELPAWLIEGMTRQTIVAVDPGSIQKPEGLTRNRPGFDRLTVTRVTYEQAGFDRLATTRSFLQTNTPLSIQELSFPKLSGATDEERERFEASSHLLVHRLLALPNGPALLGQFIQMLPRTLNWQTALFSVYKRHFDGPLPFEKWWMLNWLEFRGRQASQYWPSQLAIERLDALLLTSVEVNAGTNSIPGQRQVKVQDLIQSTDVAVQRELLGQKSQQMFFMAVNVPTDLLPLWTAYQRALDTYLQKRSTLDLQPTLKSDPEQKAQAIVKSAVKAFDELDFARGELKAGRTLVLPKDLNVQARR